MSAPERLKVWYCCQVGGAEELSSTKFEPEASADIDDFKKWLAKSEESPFKGTIPSKLEVFLSKANFTGEKPSEFDETQPLDPGLLLASFKTTSKTPLLVKGPASVAGFSSLSSSSVLATLPVPVSIESIIATAANLCKLRPRSVWDREDVPIDTNLPWVDRVETQILYSMAVHNLNKYRECCKVKQEYQLPIVHGGVGVGKSRLIYELPISKLATEKDVTVVYLYVDFSVGDALEPEIETTPSMALGWRLASHFFFGISGRRMSDFISQYYGLALAHERFRFMSVVEEIRKRAVGVSGAEKPLVLVLHLDETQKLSLEMRDGMLREIGRLLLERPQGCEGVTILPFMSGTAMGHQLDVQASDFVPKPLLLGTFTEGQVNDILKRKLPDPALLSHSLVTAAVRSLGNVGRFLQFFIAELEKLHCSDDWNRPAADVIRQILEGVNESIKHTCTGTELWNRLFEGKGKEAVVQICLYGLTKKKMRLSDHIYGQTVERVKDSGILYLQPVSKEQTEFTFSVPLAFIRALNSTYQFADGRLFDITVPQNWSGFELFVALITILRVNSIAATGNQATLEDIFVGAWGRKATLSRSAVVQHIRLMYCRGSSSQHDSLHKMNPTKIPILSSWEGATASIFDGRALFLNVEKAPWADGAYSHPRPQGPLVLLQFKASEKIFQGEHPDQILQKGSKTTQLLLGSKGQGPKGSIWNEYEKIMAGLAASPGWTELDTVVVIISNKPFKFPKDPEELPPNTLVISNERFSDFAGQFAMPSIFLPIKRTQTTLDDLFQQPLCKRQRTSPDDAPKL